MRNFTKSLLVGVAATISMSTVVSAQRVEVLHRWHSSAETAVLNVLKDDLLSQGISWRDVTYNSRATGYYNLRDRVTAKDAPTAAQMHGFSIQDWAEAGTLANLNAIAAEEGWDSVVPAALQRFSKYEGNWVATPVNVHSTNWVWANKGILDDLGLSAPQTWDDFVAAMEVVKASGKIALALGGEAWQVATMFEGVVLSVGGVDFYMDAFIDLNPKALGSDMMVEAFDRMATLRSFVDKHFLWKGPWYSASAMVINDEAAFQIMGDWAKVEFLNAGKTPGEDFLCFRVPGSAGSVSFIAEQFAMFSLSSAEAQAAQGEMARAIMSPSFQSAFNVARGSVPARTDVPNDAFDACGKQGMAELAAAGKSGSLVGSMAHGHANRTHAEWAMHNVITPHFYGEYDSATAAEKLSRVVNSIVPFFIYTGD